MGNTNDLLEKSITIVIILFILSMISERIVTFLKIRYGKRGAALPGFSNVEEDMSTSNADPEMEKLREQRIIGLTIVISILLAILAHASFFDIMRDDVPYTSIGWESSCSQLYTHTEYLWKSNPLEVFAKVLSFLLGCGLTGLFISLGSKFWHDTLDMLFYAKNLKEKLAKPSTYSVQSVEELSEYLELTDRQIANIAKEKHEAGMLEKGATEVWVGYHKSRKSNVLYAAIDHVSKWNLIPKQVQIQLPKTQRTVIVPVEVMILGKVEALSGPGSRIFNNKDNTKGGTWSCVVQSTVNQKVYLMSCYHVLKSDIHQFGWLNDGRDTTISSNQFGSDIARLESGNIDNSVDVGLAALSDPTKFDNKIEELGKTITEYRSLTYADEVNETKVSFKGAKHDSYLTGRIIFIDKSPTIEYNNSFQQKINQLFTISSIESKNYKAVTVKGDSGALIVDSSGKALGIVVGADEAFTYAIPIDRIMKRYNLTFYTHEKNTLPS